jgi:predicted transcriptional regulator
MYWLFELIATPIFFVQNSFSNIKLQLGIYGIGPKAHLFDPNWWLQENKDRDLSFTKSKNNKKKIVYELLKSNPEGIDKSEILKKVKIKYDDLRSIISQLRDDIENQNIYKQILVEKGIYKIIVFNRKLDSIPLLNLS